MLKVLLSWRSLLWLSVIWWWMYLTQRDFLSTTSLPWSLALHSLLFQSGEASTVEGNKQTHAHTRTHTHTHTHARTHEEREREGGRERENHILKMYLFSSVIFQMRKVYFKECMKFIVLLVLSRGLVQATRNCSCNLYWKLLQPFQTNCFRKDTIRER